jgi:hypothetical protein
VLIPRLSRGRDKALGRLRVCLWCVADLVVHLPELQGVVRAAVEVTPPLVRRYHYTSRTVAESGR